MITYSILWDPYFILQDSLLYSEAHSKTHISYLKTHTVILWWGHILHTSRLILPYSEVTYSILQDPILHTLRPIPPYCVCRFEKGGHVKGGLQSRPTLAGKVFSLTDTCLWLELLLAALDCYNWVFGEQLLSPSEVFLCEWCSSISTVDFESTTAT